MHLPLFDLSNPVIFLSHNVKVEGFRKKAMTCAKHSCKQQNKLLERKSWKNEEKVLVAPNFSRTYEKYMLKANYFIETCSILHPLFPRRPKYMTVNGGHQEGDVRRSTYREVHEICGITRINQYQLSLWTKYWSFN